MAYRSPTATQLAHFHFSSLPPTPSFLQPRRQRLQKLPRRLLHQSKQRQTARQRKPTSIRSHRQPPAMNATTASFLRRRQRAQHLLRETPRKASRKAPRKALKKAPASQCACASQKRAIRIAAIASVHVNCTAQSRVNSHTLHCPSIASKSGGWGGFGDVLPRRAKEALARVSVSVAAMVVVWRIRSP